MREIKSSEAKTHLLRLLDEVEQGETIVITRRGTPIARIIPEPDSRAARVDAALKTLAEIGKRGSLTIAEAIAFKNEGRKY